MCTVELLQHVFRSETDEEIPLFKARVACLREAGQILCEAGTPSSDSAWRVTNGGIELRRVDYQPHQTGG